MKKTVLSMLAAVLMIFLMSGTVCGAVSETANKSMTNVPATGTSVAGTSAANKSVTVTEVPDIRIVLNGSLTSFKNVPVSVNGNTLLPLREFLVSLGVPDDGSSFRYDSKEKTVGVTYEQISILLFIGKKEAYINNEPVVLNAAPVLYRNLTYIPARSIAEAFGKKVVWDKSTRSILICDAEKYEVVKEILAKSNEAALKAERYRMYMDVTAVSKAGLVKEEVNVAVQNEVDRANKKMHMELLMKVGGFEFKSAVYYSDNASYTLDPLSGSWLKTLIEENEYNKLFEEQNTGLGLRDALYAGLSQTESEDVDEIRLSGDVYMADLYQNALRQQTGAMGSGHAALPDFDTFDLTIVLDKNTYLIKSMIMDTASKEKKDGMTVTTDIDVSVRFEYYNGEFGITVPEDVIKKAVENETAA